MTAQLTLKDVTNSYAGRTVLDGISLTVSPGEHVAVVGDNGSGKSTLLRLIAGQEPPDEGTVTVSAGAHGGVGHLGQTPVPPGARTVQQFIDEALAGLRRMERRLRELESDLAEERMAEYGDLLTAYVSTRKNRRRRSQPMRRPPDEPEPAKSPTALKPLDGRSEPA